MEKISERVESFIEAQAQAFEDRPIATGIKILIVVWLFKLIYRELRK